MSSYCDRWLWVAGDTRPSNTYSLSSVPSEFPYGARSVKRILPSADHFYNIRHQRRQTRAPHNHIIINNFSGTYMHWWSSSSSLSWFWSHIAGDSIASPADDQPTSFSSALFRLSPPIGSRCDSVWFRRSTCDLPPNRSCQYVCILSPLLMYLP